mmetsp:Transcript_1139/g.2165  ORF Transcript_1139/g.2165 Transcript_1139/m.2165 type:complete len:83 (-) Transcript_1139:524-772(-)
MRSQESEKKHSQRRMSVVASRTVLVLMLLRVRKRAGMVLLVDFTLSRHSLVPKPGGVPRSPRHGVSRRSFARSTKNACAISP